MRKFDPTFLTPEQKQILDEFYHRRQKIDTFLRERNIPLFTCPGCGYPTLGEKGGYEICDVCGWEDDGQDDPHADEVWGGPNSDLSPTLNRLEIGTYLFQYAKELDGTINDDPAEVIYLLNGHLNEITALIPEIPAGTDFNKPGSRLYHPKATSMLQRLIRPGNK